MGRTPAEFAEYMHYLWRGTTLKSIAQRIALKLISPIIKNDSAYIALRYPAYQPATHAPVRPQEVHGFTAVIVENFEELNDLGDTNPDEKIMSTLRDHFQQGAQRVAIAVLLQNPDETGCTIVGYLGLDRGEFSYWSGRLRGVLPADCMYMGDFYVVPTHRGQRLIYAVSKALIVYARENGIKKYVGFIKTHNTPSVKAHLRHNEDCVNVLGGTIRRATVFGGLFDRVTPGEEVLSILNGPMPSLEITRPEPAATGTPSTS